MRRSLFLTLFCLMLTACNPNKAESEPPNGTSIIDIEQHQRDAAALLEAENALLDQAQVELSQTESILLKRTELESEQNEQLILNIAKREKMMAEQKLTENTKKQSDKAQALLKQAVDAEKTTPDSKF